jgi:hypothetical protein
MATEDYPQRAPEPSGWAVGGMVFAGTMMLLIGVFQGIVGLAAIINDEFFITTRNYAFDLDISGWGWIHLLLGILVGGAGFALFAGRTGAAYFAIFLASLSAVANFFFIPYYPFWSILLIAIAVWVIWSLTRPGITEP